MVFPCLKPDSIIAFGLDLSSKPKPWDGRNSPLKAPKMIDKLVNLIECLKKKNCGRLPSGNLTPYQFLQSLFPSPYKKMNKSKQTGDCYQAKANKIFGPTT